MNHPCVCTHPAADHQDVTMAVPLPGKELLYPAPMVRAMGAMQSRRNAPYTRVECHCGCGDYLADVIEEDGDDDYLAALG